MATALPCDADWSYWQPRAAGWKKDTSSAKRRMRYKRSSILGAQKQAFTLKSMFCTITTSTPSHTLRAEANEFVPQVEMVLVALSEVHYASGDEGAKCVVPKRRELQTTCQAEQLPVITLVSEAEVFVVEECADGVQCGSSFGGSFVEPHSDVYVRTCMGQGRGHISSCTVGKGGGGVTSNADIHIVAKTLSRVESGDGFDGARVCPTVESGSSVRIVSYSRGSGGAYRTHYGKGKETGFQSSESCVQAELEKRIAKVIERADRILDHG